jgi:hypothetical protein
MHVLLTVEQFLFTLYNPRNCVLHFAPISIALLSAVVVQALPYSLSLMAFFFRFFFNSAVLLNRRYDALRLLVQMLEPKRSGSSPTKASSSLFETSSSRSPTKRHSPSPTPITLPSLSLSSSSVPRYQPEDIIVQVVSTITALVLSAPVWREQAQSVGVIDLLVKHMQLSMESPTITALSGAIEVRT